MAILLRDAPIDLMLDDDGDLAIVDGDAAFSRGTSGVKQAVKIAIQLCLKEWFLDQSAGTDWFGAILGKSFDPLRARETIRDAILGVDGIVDLTDLAVALDAGPRRLTINWRAVGAFGDTIADTLVFPLAVEG